MAIYTKNFRLNDSFVVKNIKSFIFISQLMMNKNTITV